MRELESEPESESLRARVLKGPRAREPKKERNTCGFGGPAVGSAILVCSFFMQAFDGSSSAHRPQVLPDVLQFFGLVLAAQFC